MIPMSRGLSGRTIAWMWGTALITLLGAWGVVVLTEVLVPNFMTFVILWGLASAGPLAATVPWARTKPTVPPPEKREEWEEKERRARRGLERERRVLGALWVSTLVAAITAALLTRWLCPESAVALPMAMAGLLVVPAAAYPFLIRPDSET